MLIRRLAVLLFGLLALWLPVSAAVSAAPAASADVMLKYVTPFGADTPMSGERVSKTVYFQIPAYWKANTAQLTLDYQVSQIIEQQNSAITLSLNGASFYSFRPSANDTERMRLNVALPAALLKSGSNALEIGGDLRNLAYNVCVPDTSQDNWLNIYGTSAIEITHSNQAMPNEIRAFNDRFTGIDNIGGGKSAITVPNQADPAELEAAAYALAGYAGGMTQNDQTIPLLAYSADPVADKYLVVLVALYDHLPAEVKSQVNGNGLDSQAVIQLIHPERQPTLVITSNNPELLVKAGRMAANLPAMAQVDGPVKAVSAQTDADTPPAAINRSITLTETGDTLKGISHQEKTYFVSLPSNRSIAGAGKISLDFRYAGNLDFDRSMVTVLINNIPIGSKKLSQPLADGDKAVFNIPADLQIAGNFSVTAAFDLELKDGGCTALNTEMPWAFITSDSVLQLNTKDRTEMLFNNYPYPFLRDGEFNHVAVVLPNRQDAHTYDAVSNLFSLLGRYAEGNNGELRFVADSVKPNELEDSNIIAIGTYADNKLLQTFNKQLYFKYNQDGSGFASNEKINLDESYAKRVGTLQLIASPLHSGNGFMAVTGPSPEYYELASSLLASEAVQYKAFGDGILIDKDGTVHQFRFKKQTGAAEDSLPKELLQRTDVLGFMIAIVLVASLVVISLILLLNKHNKRKKRRGGR